MTASGHFQADVELNARFGVPIPDDEREQDGPTHAGWLGGTIDNFRTADTAQGTDHVDSTWSVTLEEGSLNNSGALRPVTGDDVTERWSAYGHGPENQRPDGFYGGFTADFDDGAAIGLYSAD